MPNRIRVSGPYPLFRRFLAVGGPVLALFLAALAGGSVLAMRSAVEDVYLQIAERRASGLAAGVRDAQPQEWRNLIDRDAVDPRRQDLLRQAIAREVDKLNLERLKVYDVAGRTLFSMIPAEIGKVETGNALKQVLEAGKPGLNKIAGPGGTAFYELYVPFLEGGRLAAVFELYEPISYLDDLIVRAMWPAAAIPAALLSLLIIVLTQLAHRAQGDIDWRTQKIAELTQRVERLVSRRAVRAMHGAEPGELPEPGIVECALFFSDIRGFTQFSEQRAPREIIGLLGRIIELQVDVLEEAGADVDKFIGDAVFARFEGTGGAAAAIRAGLAIQRRLVDEPLPLSVGIGIASGPVVVGVIGAADRYDYTVLGDPVNVASRLCSVAGSGEMVVERKTAGAAGYSDGKPETIALKGRTGTVEVLRVPPAPPLFPGAA